MNFQTIHTVILLVTITLSFNTNAATTDSGSIKVASIRFSTSYFKVKFSPAPQGCGGGDDSGMHAIVPPTVAYHDELVSALLTAYVADIKLSRIWYSEASTCGPGSPLNLVYIRYEDK